MDVGTWLERLGLGQYERAFLDNDVDAEVLPELVAEDLAGLGVASIGHRRKLLAAIAALRAEVSPLQGPRTGQQPAAVREAERRQLTVMFADLVGSTELASQLDPEEMREVLRAYQDAVTGEVARYEGHVAKLVGDGVLAYFGWPTAHEDEAERAVRAGLSVVAAVGRLAAPGGGALAVRVGIATGLVVVGDLVGHGAAEQEAVFGETPNLAARMQAVAEPASVVVAPGTHRLAGDLFAYADLGTRRLKGFPEPVRAWRVIGPGQRVSRFEAREAAAVMPLLGREEELAFLLERWNRARSGHGQIVLLAGEPGIGKSRLLRALRDTLDPEPHMALRHQCSPYHTHTALHPVIEQLERAAGFEREEAAEARLAKLQTLLARGEPDMTRTVALLADLLGIEAGSRHSPPQLTARQQKKSTFAALLDQLVALAARSPLLVTLEDAHWIDPSTLELLDLAVDRVQDVPVLMVITYRPEFIPPWLGRPHVGSLTLRRLGRQLSAAMVGSVAGGQSLPTAVIDQIVAKTDGVPLFVEELTKAVLESGLLLGDDYRDPVVRLPLVLPIPDTLQDSLMARLDRLAPVKEVAQLAACIGREFDHALLAAVAPLGGKELATALDRLVEAELVFRHGAPPNATYTFKHALVQDAACQSLLKSRRQQHHGRIAAVLEERFPHMVESQPEVVARHCAEAGLIEKAADYRHKAAQVAMRRSAMAEAVAQVRHGLVLLSALPASPARTQKEIDLQLDLGHALTTLKGLAAPDTGAAYGRARELCRELGAAGPEPVALHGVWRFLHNRAELGARRRPRTSCCAGAKRAATWRQRWWGTGPLRPPGSSVPSSTPR